MQRSLNPVAPTPRARTVVRPVQSAVLAEESFWGRRQRRNRTAGIPEGARRLDEAGNREDLRRAAQRIHDGSSGDGPYRGPLFMDSDVYKFIEALAWEIGRKPDEELVRLLDEWTAAIVAAQAEDGYINSYVEVTTGGEGRYTNLEFGHELYCMGHLIQAAVAAHRAAGNSALLEVARKVADHLGATFGVDGDRRVEGHPVIEMALVELYRETGEDAYLALARHFVDVRGAGRLRSRERGPAYFSDRIPVREATSVEGHAVRALYFAAGVADVAMEGPEDTELVESQQRQWSDLVATKTYITGGFGSRWDGESFGDPYELPPDRAYCETCAAIAGIQWSWRLLLSTGAPRYAELIERILFNGFAAGFSLGGDEFFYVNALQLRSDAGREEARAAANGRRRWFDVACCPPNVMRTLAQLGGYMATSSADGVQLQQYASGSFAAELDTGAIGLDVRTEYPFDGLVEVSVTGTPEVAWTLALRIPGWCNAATAVVRDAHGASFGEITGVPGQYLEVKREWSVGDRVVLDLPMPVRRTIAHHRVDAVRGAAAIERGPLVYCFEQCDQPSGHLVDDLVLEPNPLVTERRDDLLDGVVVVLATGRTADPRAAVTSAVAPADAPERFVAIPYFAWANRALGPMRVFTPYRSSS